MGGGLRRPGEAGGTENEDSGHGLESRPAETVSTGRRVERGRGQEETEQKREGAREHMHGGGDKDDGMESKNGGTG